LRIINTRPINAATTVSGIRIPDQKCPGVGAGILFTSDVSVGVACVEGWWVVTITGVVIIIAGALVVVVVVVVVVDARVVTMTFFVVGFKVVVDVATSGALVVEVVGKGDVLTIVFVEFPFSRFIQYFEELSLFL
jgi:hypothetical protein